MAVVIHGGRYLWWCSVRVVVGCRVVVLGEGGGWLQGGGARLHEEFEDLEEEEEVIWLQGRVSVFEREKEERERREKGDKSDA
ncbi:hypothetical protein HanRHA438_Chr16g0775861 [Helianthus annuus]|nr:hypothetical protein HanRHA438_Chr16g0775861 [Helianthus annuus]